MRARVALRHLRRDARGGLARLVFFVACLAIGVAAVVSVAGFRIGLERGIRGEARQLLAADLAIRGRQPIPPEVVELVENQPGSDQVELLEMLTLVATTGDSETPGRSQLVELKSVNGDYPFYGSLELEPSRPLAELLGEDGAVAEQALLERLGLGLGDRLKVGSTELVVRAIVRREPDRVADAFTMGPRLLISHQGLERSELEQFGSRIVYRRLVRLPGIDDTALDQLANQLRETLPGDDRFRVETYREAQPALRQGLERMDRYLGLAALLSLLIGGIGVAQTVRAWLAGRLDSIAILKCLGYRPREIMALYLGQTVLLALAGSVAGIALGVAVELLAIRLLSDLLPVGLIDPWQPAAALRGLALGLGIALIFSLPPLAAASRVPPIRVLRRDTEPLPPSRRVRLLTAAALLGALVLVASLQSRSLLLGALFTAGLLLASGALAAAAKGLMQLARRPRQRARPSLRHGLAALGRPGASTLGSVVALGLGVLVLVTMLLVEKHLGATLDRDLPSEAPTAFMIDIQPDQWPGVEQILTEGGAENVDSVPVIMARISSIDGRDAEEITADLVREKPVDDDSRWALRREQRLTYLEQLPADNEIVAGELWSLPDVAELSVEADFAADLGLAVGSKVLFDIQGVTIELQVTSLRKVDWQTFGINFFLVAEPGVLDQAPQHRVAAARLPPTADQALQDQLAADYPNVTMIRIREILERISAILARLALGIRLLGGLTVLAGLAILAGATSAGALRRGAEVALYKTLGMTRWQVLLTYATEYALVGLLAGVIGTLGGGALAWAVLKYGMKIEWLWPVAELTAAPLLTALLAVTTGLAASLRALQRRPVEVLRGVGS